MIEEQLVLKSRYSNVKCDSKFKTCLQDVQ